MAGRMLLAAATAAALVASATTEAGAQDSRPGIAVLSFENGGSYGKDKEDFARSTEIAKGKDVYAEASIGLGWQFRDKCLLRLQYAYSHNSSNIDIYDFNRNEISSTIRCEMI